MAIIAAGYYQLVREPKVKANTTSVLKSTLHVDSMTAYEGVPDTLSVGSSSQLEFPACPVCADATSNQQHKHPCQQHNIKQDLYHGIEVGENRWIRMACEEAHLSVQDGGGPFGAVVVQIDDESKQVIRHWRCRNLVTKNIDPTAHAEVSAIRTVAQALGVFDLGKIHRDSPELNLPQPSEYSHCEIYSSCEPCPMCYAAIRWARIDTVVFAATRFDAAEPGVDFSDLALYRELATAYKDRHDGKLRVFQSTTKNSLDAFNLWKNTDKIAY
jgi:guanine deaminase